ncbi:hypothetical protein [Pseudophaeobacter sp.]|uniref:hypothetical protein n=1 Tax=Pseudophaeobacter sp. TaxID=1971739 RepID=UPI003299BFE4
MQLPEHILEALTAKVEQHEFSSPVCLEMTRLLVPEILSEKISLQYIKHLDDDTVSRADRYKTLADFSKGSVYREGEFIELLVNDSFNEAIAKVCTSQGIKGISASMPNKPENDKVVVSNWYNIVKDILSMNSWNLAIILMAVGFSVLYVTGELSFSDFKDILIAFLESEKNPLNLGRESSTIR